MDLKSDIANKLKTKWIGKQIYYYEETLSTNLDCKTLAQNDALEGTVVIADYQTKGRGRRGRDWESPKGTSISFSILLRPRLNPDKASMLTLLQAMAVVKAIKEVCNLDAKIKWPNDVVVNDKKVCGILTEMHMETDSVFCVIVGTGINVNQECISEELKQKATSLRIERGNEISRADILERVLYWFEYYYDSFLKIGDLSTLQTTYNDMLVSMNREVKVLDPMGSFQGIAKGINEKGELIVQLKNGSLQYVYAGEVSVRGLYGYV